MRNLTKDELADLKAWRDDQRGIAFWEALQDIAEKATKDMRSGSRVGDSIKTAFHSARLDTVEDVVALVSEIIEDNAERNQKESLNV